MLGNHYLSAMRSMAKGTVVTKNNPNASIDKSVAVAYAEQIVTLVDEVERLQKLVEEPERKTLVHQSGAGNGYGFTIKAKPGGSGLYDWTVRYNGRTFNTGASFTYENARERAFDAIEKHSHDAVPAGYQLKLSKGGGFGEWTDWMVFHKGQHFAGGSNPTRIAARSAALQRISDHQRRERAAEPTRIEREHMTFKGSQSYKHTYILSKGTLGGWSWSASDDRGVWLGTGTAISQEDARAKAMDRIDRDSSAKFERYMSQRLYAAPVSGRRMSDFYWRGL